jgi:hypothetical protein
MGKLWNQIKYTWQYFAKRDKQLRDFAVGMSSEVDIRKDLHILFMDYDEVSLEQVEESVREAQSFWNLSDCFIYKTRKGYHTYFYFDIMPYSRVVMIINYARYVDDMFRYISRYYDYKTIRVAGKYKERDISYVKTLPGPRKPTFYEAEVGDLKRKEREMLLHMGNLFRKDKLKD